jgi:hypothetical protein
MSGETNGGCFRDIFEIVLLVGMFSALNKSNSNSQDIESLKQDVYSLKIIELQDTNIVGTGLPETVYRPNDSTTFYLKIDGKPVANYLDSLNAL